MELTLERLDFNGKAKRAANPRLPEICNPWTVNCGEICCKSFGFDHGLTERTFAPRSDTTEIQPMIGMAAAVALLVVSQAPLPRPKQPSVVPTVPPAPQYFTLPPPTTASYYASAPGPSRQVGWPTSLYGPIMPPPDLSSPVPYFLVNQARVEPGPGPGCGGHGCGHKRGLFGKKQGCDADMNGLGCGNFRTEATFLFGSCRAFFGESCQPGRPCPTPWDLLYGTNPPPQ